MDAIVAIYSSLRNHRNVINAHLNTPPVVINHAVSRDTAPSMRQSVGIIITDRWGWIRL